MTGCPQRGTCLWETELAEQIGSQRMSFVVSVASGDIFHFSRANKADSGSVFGKLGDQTAGKVNRSVSAYPFRFQKRRQRRRRR